MTQQCNCQYCQSSRTARSHIEKMRDAGLNDSVEWLNAYLDYVANLEMDYDVACAIIDGSWPTADQWIERKRLARQEKITTKKE